MFKKIVVILHHFKVIFMRIIIHTLLMLIAVMPYYVVAQNIKGSVYDGGNAACTVAGDAHVYVSKGLIAKNSDGNH